MSRTRKKVRWPRLGWAAAGLAALALVAAACGGSGGSSAGGGGGLYGAAPTPSSSAPAPAVVDLRSSQLGQILVDGQGRTLYLFEADTAGRSTCDGACATAWPPYLSTGAPKAGMGVTGSLLGSTDRGEGGGAQATYRGHPLYYYVGDAEPGDTAGQGLDQFGARWYVLAANGDSVVGR